MGLVSSKDFKELKYAFEKQGEVINRLQNNDVIKTEVINRLENDNAILKNNDAIKTEEIKKQGAEIKELKSNNAELKEQKIALIKQVINNLEEIIIVIYGREDESRKKIDEKIQAQEINYKSINNQHDEIFSLLKKSSDQIHIDKLQEINKTSLSAYDHLNDLKEIKLLTISEKKQKIAYVLGQLITYYQEYNRLSEKNKHESIPNKSVCNILSNYSMSPNIYPNYIQ